MSLKLLSVSLQLFLSLMEYNMEDREYTLNKLKELAGINANNKGFHADYISLKAIIRNGDKRIFTSNQIKQALETLKCIEQCKDLALIQTEISEAIEHLRNGRLVNEDNWKETMEEEIADTLIRILDFCYTWNIDIQKLVNLKMQYNLDREPMHGKMF